MVAPPLLGYSMLHVYSMYGLIYMALITPAKKPQKKKKLMQRFCRGKSIESRDNATEGVNATSQQRITLKSIISAQRALNGILTPEMPSYIDRIA